MDNFIFSVNIVLPIVIVCYLGYFLKGKGMINQNFIDVSSKILFNACIPCTVFSSVALSSIDEIFNLRLVLFAVIAILAVVAVLVIIVPRFVKDKPKAASMVQGMFRSNFVMLGIPIAINMFGTEGASHCMLIIPFAITLFNVLSVHIFTTMVPINAAKESGIKSSVKNIIRNPLIIACVVSIAFALLPISLPIAVLRSVESVGSITSPLAFLMLGASFELEQLSSNLKYTIPYAIIRLIVTPLIVLSVAVALGFRQTELGSLFILFSAPTAVTSYIMARNMGGDADIASQIVCITTLFSAVSVVFGIYILKTFAFI